MRKRFDGHIAVFSISLEDEMGRVTAEAEEACSGWLNLSILFWELTRRQFEAARQA
ncbi:hypothetical protein [Rhizobium anhuiense]|uniref:hypothetical protein n=1 Tax=Rhizobium anhuiense TaxID=1184720 RepID=UPI0014046A4D|nr:hypothetical protein [Rhizobium anhuiense]